jgi:hypothetical protein
VCVCVFFVLCVCACVDVRACGYVYVSDVYMEVARIIKLESDFVCPS